MRRLPTDARFISAPRRIRAFRVSCVAVAVTAAAVLGSGCVGAVGDTPEAGETLDAGNGQQLPGDVTLLAANAVWSYREGDAPAGWTGLNFDASSWKTGKAELGFGDSDETTALSPGNPRRIAFYFRRTFTVPAAGAYSAVRVRFVRDDGAVLYLNGKEVGRSNMPAGAITSTTPAADVVGIRAEEQRTWEVTIPSSMLTTGINIFAAEVHQSSASSSDVTFRANIVATASKCVIAGVTYADGAKNPANPCEICSPLQSVTAWTAASPGAACDDGAYCTVGDQCNATGQCVGTARSCSDALTCTSDSCNEASDACVSSVASGCAVANACVVSGATNPSNSCEKCDPVTSATSWTATPNCGTPTDTAGPGASLPIQYDVNSVSGTKWFVATTGNDANAGTVAAPLRSLAAAIAKVASGQSATIIVRGGEYTDGNVTVGSGRAIRIVAYPGELPVFRGSDKFDGGWTTEGALAWHAYTAQPVTDGAGISFTTGQNLTGSFVGKHPDQAWIGATELRQVTTKAEVAAGKFWVDAASGRLYLTATDAAKAGIEASKKDRFISIQGANSGLEGLRITRFSNSANDYGVVLVGATASGSVLRHVEIIDPAFHSVVYSGEAGRIMQGALIDHVTIRGPNWMGVGAVYVDDLTIRDSLFVGANSFGEFTTSPQSGALKTGRCRRIKVLDSEISGNQSHGLWFDQSNVDVDVAGNVIVDNAGSGVFFEISDDLLLINNFIRSTGGNRAVKLAGSSGLKLVNNTILGGADPVGIYTDNRSKPGCSDPSQPLCADSYNSDRDSARTRPVTLDWMPRLDLMLNNIVAYPTSAGYCGAATGVCVTSKNQDAIAPVESIIHKADAARGISQTRMDGNVYANGAGSILRHATGNYATHSAWSTAAAGTPIFIAGLDANSKTGNAYVNADGSITAQLSHGTAVALPADADINKYLAAGTRHYGWLQ